MKVDAVDLFYLSAPSAGENGAPGQDTLLVRVRAGSYEGWGEGTASPLTAIAGSLAANPIVGEPLDTLDDIARIGSIVRSGSIDPGQANHLLSGIDTALWDLMGKRFEQPVYRLLGYPKAYPKMPYVSVRFGNTGVETIATAKQARQDGFRAVKFGRGPFGKSGPKEDQEQLVAAREGLGKDGILLVDAGAVWGEDVPRAIKALRSLRLTDVLWLEDPLTFGSLSAYAAVAEQAGHLRLASGAQCPTVQMAQSLMDYGRIGYAQIDVGRIGGISSAKRVIDLAIERKVTAVNHPANSHLAFSASLQCYAGLPEHRLCGYPVGTSPVVRDLTVEPLRPEGEEGLIYPPDAPGHGMAPNLTTMRAHLVNLEIVREGRTLYRTPEL
jgi:L-alanine-DL-glutamate epimerase-like enolase superfamily enzyme